MLLPTLEGVLHAKFEIPSSKTVTCSLWTDKQMDQLGWVTRKNTRGETGCDTFPFGGGKEADTCPFGEKVPLRGEEGDASPFGVRPEGGYCWLPDHFVI